MSFAYFYGSLLYAIPTGKAYSSFEKLFFPFKYIIWTCIASMFVIASLVLIILKSAQRSKRDFFIGSSNNMPFFNMVNICLGGTISFHNMPKRNFARTILMIWLISTLVLRNAYQGKLYDNLRKSQRQAPFFQLGELYASNLKLYLYESFFQNIANQLTSGDHHR